jgi:DNA-binding NarL/FixJ family response regulator
MAGGDVPGIGASRDLRPQLAHVFRFRLAVMRAAAIRATLRSMALRTLIVDDSLWFLNAASDLLEREGLSVVGVASTGDETRRQAEALRPDVILVDVFLGQESGLDLARRLVEESNGATVILISSHSEADLADLIAASPAAGFVPKTNLSADAIRRIVNGRAG